MVEAVEQRVGHLSDSRTREEVLDLLTVEDLEVARDDSNLTATNDWHPLPTLPRWCGPNTGLALAGWVWQNDDHNKHDKIGNRTMMNKQIRESLGQPDIDDVTLHSLWDTARKLGADELRVALGDAAEKLEVTDEGDPGYNVLWHEARVMRSLSMSAGYDHLAALAKEKTLMDSYKWFMRWATENIWGEFHVHPFDREFFVGMKDYLQDEGDQVYLEGHDDAFQEFGDPACYDHDVEYADWKSKEGAFVDRDRPPHDGARLHEFALIRSMDARWASSFGSLIEHKEWELGEVVRRREVAAGKDRGGRFPTEYAMRATVQDIRTFFGTRDVEIYL